MSKIQKSDIAYWEIVTIGVTFSSMSRSLIPPHLLGLGLLISRLNLSRDVGRRGKK